MDIQKRIEQRIEASKKASKEPENQIDTKFVMKCLPLNVVGDAMIFIKLFRDMFIFHVAMNLWLFWVGHYWDIDKKGLALDAVKQVAEVYFREAKKLSKKIKELKDDDPAERTLKADRKALNNRGFSLLDLPRALRCLTLAHTGENGLVATGDEFDKAPWLLACENGVIDLKLGDIREGWQSDYLLKHSPVEWAGINAPCPIFEKTLTDIFLGNSPLIKFFQRVLGLALIGMVLLSKLIVLVGKGRNGKTLLMEIVSLALGSLSKSIRPEVLLDQGRVANPSGASPEKVAMIARRILIASETGENGRISTPAAKLLTGDDTTSVRGPYDRFEIEFKPSHTLFLLTNHKPHAPADDFAFWERIILIPFEVSFVDREPKNENERRANPELKIELEKELPGILAWMVRGCLEYQKTGLEPPVIVTDAVEEYRRDEDTVADFIDDCCVIGAQCSVSATDVYSAFRHWWTNNVSKNPPSQHKFGRWFKKKFESKKTPDVKYFGVGLLDTTQLFQD